MRAELLQEEYFKKFSPKPVTLKPFDPQSKIVAENLARNIKELLEGIDCGILHIGSTAYEIAGKGEIEVLITPRESDWLKVLDKLTKQFGGTDNQEKDYAKINTQFDNFDCEIIVEKGYQALLDAAKCRYLINHPQLLKEYEELKKEYSDNKQDYEKRKDEFMVRVARMIPEVKINRAYNETREVLDKVGFEYDLDSETPAWIYASDPNFKARFLAVSVGDNSEVLYRRFTGNFYYPISWTIDPELEKRFYAKYARYYDQNTLKNNLPMAQFLLEKLRQYSKEPNPVILDACCGTGIFSNLAAQNGLINLTLLDISEAMLEVAKDKPAIKNAEFICGSITEAELPKNKFDAVVSVMMLDAVKDVDLPKALNNFRSALKPNGLLLLIEDKPSTNYETLFEKLESGPYQLGDLLKYYFIGKSSTV